jgi:hypothetical protein
VGFFGFGSTSIRSTVVTGQTEGLKVGCGGMGGRKDGWRNGWIGGQREKVRGMYRFNSLMKQNKKGKNCAVFCFAGKRNFFIYIYDVITWEK